jgi:hypothetical protein
MNSQNDGNVLLYWHFLHWPWLASLRYVVFSAVARCSHNVEDDTGTTTCPLY